MSGFDLKTAIGSIAPTLATMLGGPLAGAAVSALAQAFGLGPTASQSDITKVMQGGAMTPETIAAVRAADQHHAEIIAQQGIDLVKLNSDHAESMAMTDAGDRDSARKREIAVKDNVPGLLAFVVTLGFFGFLAYLAMYTVPKDSRDLLNIMVGSLGTAWAGIIAYYFGSSSGQAKAQELLSKAPAIER